MLDFDNLPEDQLLTTDELATWIRKSKRTIENLRRDNPKELPVHIKIGRGIFYRVAAVRSYFRKKENESREAVEASLGA